MWLMGVSFGGGLREGAVVFRVGATAWRMVRQGDCRYSSLCERVGRQVVRERVAPVERFVCDGGCQVGLFAPARARTVEMAAGLSSANSNKSLMPATVKMHFVTVRTLERTS